MEKIVPRLGARVVVEAFLLRKSTVLDHGRSKVWERVPAEEPVTGLYIGRRMKSNGYNHFDFESGIEYRPIAFFEAWLVVHDDKRDFLTCLPSDVKEIKENDDQESSRLAGS